MRGEQIKHYLAGTMLALEPNYAESLMETINSTAIETINTISEAHSYEKRGQTAIITIDGATTKKNTWINAMCGGLIGYDTIGQYIDKAENDPEVTTILFNVDSPGGEVAGVVEIGEKIFNSKKKTVTFYNNLGASAALFAFTGSKELYANETALIGSIGVMSGYYKQGKNDNKVVLVSKNAKNKTCSVDEDCATKIQARIDSTEEIFYAKIQRNTGFTAEQIKTVFKEGDVISAREALDAGFIKGIMTLDALLATMPTADSDKMVNSKTGAKMEFTKENFDSLLSKVEAYDSELSKATEQVDKAVAIANAKSSELEALKADHEKELSALASKMEARVIEAMTYGVNIDTALAMIKASTDEEASKLAISSIQSQGGTAQTELNKDQEKELAIRESKLGVVFI